MWLICIMHVYIWYIKALVRLFTFYGLQKYFAPETSPLPMSGIVRWTALFERPRHFCIQNFRNITLMWWSYGLQDVIFYFVRLRSYADLKILQTQIDRQTDWQTDKETVLFQDCNNKVFVHEYDPEYNIDVCVNWKWKITCGFWSCVNRKYVLLVIQKINSYIIMLPKSMKQMKI